jgi:hypothetical protein
MLASGWIKQLIGSRNTVTSSLNDNLVLKWNFPKTEMLSATQESNPDVSFDRLEKQLISFLDLIQGISPKCKQPALNDDFIAITAFPGKTFRQNL